MSTASPVKMHYPVVADYATLGSKRRPGTSIAQVKFIVAHDTGNPGASARNHARWYRNDPNPPPKLVSSAHIFVDDLDIVETIPALTGDPEVAYHVRYSVDTDNKMFEADANSSAIGVEYCFGGTIDAADTYSVTVNGTTFETTGATTAQGTRDALIALVNADDTLGVIASAGRTVGEVLFTASTPGTPFTFSNTFTSDAGTVTEVTVDENQLALYKPLNVDDLVINGIKIRATTAADDTKSSSVASSSDPSASAIAIAAAINASSSETGVRALANPVISKGLSTVTSLPTTDASGTVYNLFINGTTVPVTFLQDETGTARREKVVSAINARTGQHGITAADNGSGVTLESDGRNFSVWFDSNEENLTAANFGLEKGGSVAQVSRVSVGTAPAAGATASIVINGQTITTAGAATDADGVATELVTAINDAITAGTLKNITVSVDGNDLEITSSVAGSPFTLSGASVSAAGATLTLATVTANSVGDNDITGIVDASATSTEAKTLYSTVRLISDPALLPRIASPIGAPPSDQLDKLKATGEPFTISVGDKGFGTDGNFMAMGFQEGSFGGRSSSDMDPPKVGRLAFQVGPSANQYITIDLADFGKNGAITGDITGDIDKNVRDKIQNLQRGVPEGSSEWHILYRKYLQEEMSRKAYS